MTNPVALLFEHAWIDTSNPPRGFPGGGELLCGTLRSEHGEIHGVDGRFPLDWFAGMTEIMYALVARWNAAR